MPSPLRPTPLVAQSLALRWAGFEVRTTKCCMSRQVRFLLQRRDQKAQSLQRDSGWSPRAALLVGTGSPLGPHHLLGLQGESNDACCQGGRSRGARVRLCTLLPQVSGHLQKDDDVGHVIWGGYQRGRLAALPLATGPEHHKWHGEQGSRCLVPICCLANSLPTGQCLVLPGPQFPKE